MHGARIIGARIKYLDQLNESLSHTIKLLFQDILPCPEISYQIEGIETNHHDIQNENTLLTLLQNVYATQSTRELAVGHSLYGPHRDDFTIQLNGCALYFSSKGIKRFFAILFTLEQIKKLNYPNHTLLLLLDDTFAEIDEINKQRLLNLLSAHHQLIYTTTTAQDLKYFPEKTQCRQINAGVLNNG